MRDYFVANTDTFGGNSGSGVFDLSTLQQVGILVRGETDYVASGSCNIVNHCPSDGCAEFRRAAINTPPSPLNKPARP